MSQGYVYILTNPSMPGLVKIGQTSRTVDERIAELNRATGVPTDFEVFAAIEVENPVIVETELHTLFANVRENDDREFFRVDPGAVEAAARGMGHKTWQAHEPDDIRWFGMTIALLIGAWIMSGGGFFMIMIGLGVISGGVWYGFKPKHDAVIRNMKREKNNSTGGTKSKSYRDDYRRY